MNAIIDFVQDHWLSIVLIIGILAALWFYFEHRDQFSKY